MLPKLIIVYIFTASHVSFQDMTLNIPICFWGYTIKNVFQKAKSQKMFEKNTKLLMHDKRAKVRRNEISNIIDYEKKV
jgi:hypothetical protein